MAFKMRICKNCYNWINEEIDKCPNCGNALTITEYSNIYFGKCSAEKKLEMAVKYIPDLLTNSDDEVISPEQYIIEKKRASEQYITEKKKALASMLITSGFSFDGYTITKYSGYISGDDAISISRGVDGLFSNATNVGQSLTDSLVKIRRQALRELKEAAYDLGCNAVIGVDFDYITLEPETANFHGGTTYLPYVFCVTANGNAVVIEKDTPAISVSAVLKEYKELFDSGIITLEEFDAKKRELLG